LKKKKKLHALYSSTKYSSFASSFSTELEAPIEIEVLPPPTLKQLHPKVSKPSSTVVSIRASLDGFGRLMPNR